MKLDEVRDEIYKLLRDNNMHLGLDIDRICIESEDDHSYIKIDYYPPESEEKI